MNGGRDISLITQRSDTSYDVEEGVVFKTYRNAGQIIDSRNDERKGVKGVAEYWETIGSREFLFISFDEKNPGAHLSFSTMGDPRDEYFYLDYTPLTQIAQKDEGEKGVLQYGSTAYKVFFDEERPPRLFVEVEVRRLGGNVSTGFGGRTVRNNPASHK